MNKIANSEMSEYWNGNGGKRWISFQGRIDASLISFGQKAMDAVKITTGERVLDIGCGCGDTSFEIALKVGLGGYVEGVDISNVILERARTRAVSQVQFNINFECADAQSYNFEPIIYDVAYSRFGVMFFNDPAVAFANIRQALKPGGRIAFICWQPINANQWVNLPLDVAANHISLPPPIHPEDPGPFSFGDVNRIERILTEAGFVNLSIEHFNTMFNVGTNLEEAITFLMNIGPASAAIEASEVDDNTRLKIINELRNKIIPYKTSYGVELGAAAWIVTATNLYL
jgi:SAM-dependent methyltransferase